MLALTAVLLSVSLSTTTFDSSLSLAPASLLCWLDWKRLEFSKLPVSYAIAVCNCWAGSHGFFLPLHGCESPSQCVMAVFLRRVLNRMKESIMKLQKVEIVKGCSQERTLQ